MYNMRTITEVLQEKNIQKQRSITSDASVTSKANTSDAVYMDDLLHYVAFTNVSFIKLMLSNLHFRHNIDSCLNTAESKTKPM